MSMDIHVKGKKISLSKNDFLASGGEGSIYVKGKTAYKIYVDHQKMIPQGKIIDLSVLSFNNIIKPENTIYDDKNVAVGYSMSYVKDTHPLCQVFTKAFKTRYNIKPAAAIKLIDRMRLTLGHIHSKNILVVDFNEMNFLTDNDFTEVYFIDVDSYQTPNYQATALMESVRDRHGVKNKFNQGTDWFSFAVVTFQIMSGIHPYKGTHPKYNGFDDRMSNNLSVFNPDVKVPKAVSDFRSLIPKALLEWYEKTFEKTLRCPPPADFTNDTVGVKTFVVQVITGTNNFMIDVIKEFDDVISHYDYHRGTEVFIVGTTAYCGHMTTTCGQGSIFGFNHGIPLVAWRDGDKLIVETFSSGQNRHEVEATDFMSSGGRIYYKYADYIMELDFTKTTPTPKLVGYTMENSTKMFPGVSIQSMLGKFVATYFPATGTSYQIKLEALKGHRIVDAKMDLGVLVVIGSRKGKYHEFIYGIEEDKIKSERMVENITYSGINMAVLDKGIAVRMTGDDKIEIFSTKNVSQVKIIEDKDVHSGMRLYAKGGKVVFADGSKMYKLEMR